VAARKRALKPSPPGNRTIDLTHAKTIGFGTEHISAAEFDAYITRPTPWLESGAALLRAAKALRRQYRIDAAHEQRVAETAKEFFKKQSKPEPIFVDGPRYRTINAQVAFLGCLAVENALKALIAARTLAAHGNPSTGKLPKVLKSHDLQDLASAANAKLPAQDDHEREVLEEGDRVIEYIGRYPSPLEASEFPVGFACEPNRVLDACERLFFRNVEECGRLMHGIDPQLKGVPVSKHLKAQRELYGMLTGFVFEPTNAEVDAQVTSWREHREKRAPKPSRWKRGPRRTSRPSRRTRSKRR
jgi:hypothetical protein